MAFVIVKAERTAAIASMKRILLVEKVGPNGWSKWLVQKVGREDWFERLVKEASRRGWSKRLVE